MEGHCCANTLFQAETDSLVSLKAQDILRKRLIIVEKPLYSDQDGGNKA